MGRGHVDFISLYTADSSTKCTLYIVDRTNSDKRPMLQTLSYNRSIVRFCVHRTYMLPLVYVAVKERSLKRLMFLPYEQTI